MVVSVVASDQYALIDCCRVITQRARVRAGLIRPGGGFAVVWVRVLLGFIFDFDFSMLWYSDAKQDLRMFMDGMIAGSSVVNTVFLKVG